MADINNTLVAIRERGFWEICDLALQVLRQYFLPLALAGAVGMVPCAVFNWWWLGNLPLDVNEDIKIYLLRLTWLGYWQLPFATAPMTLLLGQMMFQRKVDLSRAWGEYWVSFPQLVWYQVLCRGIMFPQGLLWNTAHGDLNGFLILWFIAWIYPLSRWAYLNEVILLERNPFRARPGQLSTSQRNAALHAGDFSMIVGRGFATAMIEQNFCFILWWGFWYLRGQFSEALIIDRPMYTILFPAVFWLTYLYLSVVRFLCYLDLRIRREGWEVDLALRAEAEQLKRGQLDGSSLAARQAALGSHGLSLEAAIK